MTLPAPAWKRLVRFEATDGKVYCGEPVDASLDIGVAAAEGKQIEVKVLNVPSALDLQAKFTGEVKTAKKILCPIAPAEAGTVRCVGLNYKDHAAELNLTPPNAPEIFLKPDTCVHSPTDPVVIPYVTADEADPEVELAVVIGKDCKNATNSNAMDYVLGYMSANDLTARGVQAKILQWGYCKGFDGFAPMGPALVSAASVPDPSVLRLKTVWNGKVTQDGVAGNMIFGIPEIIAYLSIGTTLKKGTVILTGTPSGIGHFRTPPMYLKEGDNVVLSVSHGVGSLVNPYVREREERASHI